MYEVACVVDAGAERLKNDDRAVVGGRVIDAGAYSASVQQVLAAVCDGVGGEAFGDEAAQLTASCFSGIPDGPINAGIIMEYIKRADELVQARQKKSLSHSKMASTIAGIYVNGSDFLAFNVGDSRVYRYRPPYIAQLSTDHSLMEELRAIGIEPGPEQEHIITHYIGGKASNPCIVDGRDKAFDCDIFMLCTDGVSDALDEIELESLFSVEEGLEAKCRRIIYAAIAKGSADNLSVVLIRRV